MSAHPRFKTTVAAIAFAVAMLALGLVNPNASLGRASCGLVCEAHVAAAPIPMFAHR